MIYYTTYISPIGTITITAENEAITRLDFCEPPKNCCLCNSLPVLMQCCRWLDAYFSAQQPDPGTLPLLLKGSGFQLTVWSILQTIPYGQTMTYGEIARRLGPKMSAQAVGGAVGRNPVSIIVPCHRVLGADGKLTGYAGGLDRKRGLLDLENIPYQE